MVLCFLSPFSPLVNLTLKALRSLTSIFEFLRIVIIKDGLFRLIIISESDVLLGFFRGDVQKDSQSDTSRRAQ